MQSDNSRIPPLHFNRWSYCSRLLIGKDHQSKLYNNEKKVFTAELFQTNRQSIDRLVVYLVVAWTTDLDLDFDYQTVSLYGYAPFSGEETCNSNPWFCKTKTSFLTTIFPIIFFIGLIFISFSRNKVEDEYITQIRESSFVSAMLIGSLLLILMTLLLYGFAYLWFSLYDVYIFLILFICIFDYRMYKLKKSTRDEK